MSIAIVTKKQYVEEREGCYRILGKRVSLDSIIYLFLAGASPESIVQSFPALTLEEVYGGITFYLANHKAVEAYLEEGEKLFEALRKHSQENNSLFYQKLRDAQKA
ncbi:MAG: DUF433 domain-containing protein [Coleofasciculaceae cyanobacterium SM2_1_6]|nr:DUF433 domain-containing protein [Coleofasciculaceae cyanobacterium SM2_1_6]